MLIGTLYAPNGNPQPGPRFKFKLAWMKRLLAHASELYVLDAPVVLAGDYNVVPTDADIYPSKSYAKNALVQPEPRALFRRLLDQGWIDALRTMHPDAPMYTFWDYMRNRWHRNAGLRIDHLLLNPKAAELRLVEAGIDREVRGVENASDRAPAWITLRDAPASRRGSRRSEGKPARKESRRTMPRAMSPSRRPLLVIDGDSFAHRSYHALPKTILRRGQRPAGAILGFANLLLRLYREEQPRAVLVAWDTLEVPTYRHEKFPAYQSGRDFDDALIERLFYLPEFVAASGFQNAKAPGYEARVPRFRRARRRKTRRDCPDSERRSRHIPACLRTHHHPLSRPRWGNGACRSCRGRARCRVEPAQVPDFIALRGDPSDKLPGAPGVGAAGAATLMQRYGTLEAALAAGRFPHRLKTRLFRSIATMNPKAPLPSLRSQKPTWSKAAALARNWELNQLAKRLEVATSSAGIGSFSD